MLSTQAGAREPQTALEAERAFAADAQAIGQWAAFRKWAAADATMFVPQPVNAQAWLKDRAEPAKAVAWQPGASYLSCDGKLAVNTGSWQRPDGSVGYFTTVWNRQPDGSWRWTLDHGDTLAAPRAVRAEPKVRTAACSPPSAPPPLVFPTGAASGWDGSPDGTLRWTSVVTPDGARRLTVYLWTGTTSEQVIDDRVAAPHVP